MNIDSWLDGQGLLYSDFALGFLLFVAGVSQWWLVVEEWGRDRCVSRIRVFIAAGYTLWSTRILGSLAFGLDPIISPIGTVAIALVAGGTTLIAVSCCAGVPARWPATTRSRVDAVPASSARVVDG